MPTGGYIDSYYSYSMRDREGFATLDTDLDVDVAIVGGGFTGVATAYELAKRGVSVALCERNRIGSGASGRNGGQVTGSLSGEAAMLREFRRTLGDDAADYIWRLRWRGREIIRERMGNESIDCDMREGHIEAALNQRQLNDLEALFNQHQQNDNLDGVQLLDSSSANAAIGTNIYKGGLFNPRNLHIHPLDYCLGQARAAVTHGASIYEQSPVQRIERGTRNRIHTPTGTITAEKVLIAGNYNAPRTGGKLSGYIIPASLGIIATAPLTTSQTDGMLRNDIAVYDRRFVLDYFRLSADNRLIFGGGTNYSGLATPNLRQSLRPSLENTFPHLKGIPIDFAWSGHDGVVINRIPHLGRVDDNMYFARGYSGHGIGLSHVAAEIMASAITGDPSELEIFESVRHMRMPVPRAVGNAMMAVGMAYYRMVDRVRGF